LEQCLSKQHNLTALGTSAQQTNELLMVNYTVKTVYIQRCFRIWMV